MLLTCVRRKLISSHLLLSTGGTDPTGGCQLGVHAFERRLLAALQNHAPPAHHRLRFRAHPAALQHPDHRAAGRLRAVRDGGQAAGHERHPLEQRPLRHHRRQLRRQPVHLRAVREEVPQGVAAGPAHRPLPFRQRVHHQHARHARGVRAELTRVCPGQAEARARQRVGGQTQGRWELARLRGGPRQRAVSEDPRRAGH